MSGLTEADVLVLLRERLTGSGNGGAGEHAFMAHVRNAAGFSATRTIDALALNLWPSRGLTLDAYEVKVSRSDWTRERKNPQKADDFCRLVDRFWLVAPAGVVHDGELPPKWGLLEVLGDGEEKPWRLRQKETAPLLHGRRDPPPLDRGLVVAMLRSIPGAVPGGRNQGPVDREVARARDEGHRAGIEHGRRLERAERSASAAEAQAWEEFGEAIADAAAEAGVGSWDSSPTALKQHASDIVAGISAESRGRERDRVLVQVRWVLERALDVLPEAPA